jgi:predicted peroxiredoxin
MEKCQSNSLLANITVEPVMVAVELGVEVLRKSPETIAKVVNLPEVQEAIKAAVDKEGKRILAEQRKGKIFVNNDAEKILDNIQKNAIKNFEANAISTIKESVDYKIVNNYLDDLKCSFNNNPMGIFVNKNKKILVIVGVIMAVGGVSYLYVSRQGDKPVDWGLDLAKSHFKGKLIGSIEGGISNIQFKPSTRNVVIEGFVKGDFKGVVYKFDLRFASLEDQVIGAGAGGSIAIPLNKDIKLSASAKAGVDRQLNKTDGSTKFNDIYELGLKLDVLNIGGLPGLNINIQAMSRNNKINLQTKKATVEHKMLIGAVWEF